MNDIEKDEEDVADGKDASRPRLVNFFTEPALFKRANVDGSNF